MSSGRLVTAWPIAGQGLPENLGHVATAAIVEQVGTVPFSAAELAFLDHLRAPGQPGVPGTETYRVAYRDERGGHGPLVWAGRGGLRSAVWLAVNGYGWRNFLAVDVDGKNHPGPTDRERRQAATSAALALPVAPTVVVESNSGAHALWAIDATPWDGGRGDQYARAVQENLRRTIRVDGVEGDTGFSAWDTRNPLHLPGGAAWSERTAAHPFQLGELRQALQDAGLWETVLEYGDRKTIAADGHGRHQTLFRELSTARSAGADLARLEAIAHHFNTARNDPLDPEETAGIVAAVSNYRTRSGSSQRHVLNGRKGGSRNTPAQQSQRTAAAHAARQGKAIAREKRANTARALKAEGLSISKIMEQLGLSKRTILNYLQEEEPPPPPEGLEDAA